MITIYIFGFKNSKSKELRTFKKAIRDILGERKANIVVVYSSAETNPKRMPNHFVTCVGMSSKEKDDFLKKLIEALPELKIEKA